MPVGRTPEQEDAVQRARAEVNLLMGKYARRLKDRAEKLALIKMIDKPTRDPDEVGREAFEQAGLETELIEAGAPKAIAGSPA